MEELGFCEVCSEVVTYPASKPGRAPTYGFDMEEMRDTLYHWDCLHEPHQQPARHDAPGDGRKGRVCPDCLQSAPTVSDIQHADDCEAVGA